MEMMPLPGYESGPSQEDIKRQLDEQEKAARSAATKEFTKEYIRQRGLEAEQTLGEVQNKPNPQGSPLNIKVKADESGVSSLGGTLTLPISKRIGVDFGGAYSVPRSQTGEVMGRPATVDSPGAAAARVGYRSPFINVDLEYAPNKTDAFGNQIGGFRGYGSMRGTF